jgi:osmotically-inducible protein OsmY
MQRKSYNQLREAVLRELKWDSRVGWAHIHVDVKDGVVRLTGTVPSYAERQAAQAAAHRVVGVLDAADDIKVKVSGQRTDAEIAKTVRGALEWDALVPEEQIQSTVSDGWVILEGSVNTLRERDDVERAVRHLEGVAGIVNSIVVTPQEANPEELRVDIEDALERRAEREGERIYVEVKDGTVELRGRIHSWQEKRAVLGSISHAPGVRAINDHLRIDPYF